MYRKILVPLDGSKRAETILPHVKPVAQLFQATILLLMVEEASLLLEHDEVIDFSPYQQGRAKLRRESEAYLASIAKSLKVEGIDAETIVKSGAVVGTIIEAAEENDIDLIAMASHGFSGLARVYYGSITAGILQCIDRPLLVIRSRN